MGSGQADYKGRLYGMRTYLAGPMDRVLDGGVVWREKLTPLLQQLGLIILDPCKKPIAIGQETAEDRRQRHTWKKDGKYDEVVQSMKPIRHIDLRMVDMADFLIAYLDTDVHMCGTYEKIFWANRLKNPVLIMCAQGKENAPDWLFATLPHQHIFSSFPDVLIYLAHINWDMYVDHMQRWLFFDYKKMVPNDIR